MRAGAAMDERCAKVISAERRLDGALRHCPTTEVHRLLYGGAHSAARSGGDESCGGYGTLFSGWHARIAITTREASHPSRWLCDGLERYMRWWRARGQWERCSYMLPRSQGAAGTTGGLRCRARCVAALLCTYRLFERGVVSWCLCVPVRAHLFSC